MWLIARQLLMKAGLWDSSLTLRDLGKGICRMNHLQPTVKFTFQLSTQQTSFLDMKIQIGANCKLPTTVFRKPTGCATLLHFHSNHSLKWKESIIFSQALRYNLLIADDHLLQKELDSIGISLTSSLTTSPKPSSTSVTSSSAKPPMHQVPQQSSQSLPHIQKKVVVSLNQCKTNAISLKMTPNYTVYGPITPSLPTTRLNPLRAS